MQPTQRRGLGAVAGDPQHRRGNRRPVDPGGPSPIGRRPRAGPARPFRSSWRPRNSTVGPFGGPRLDAVEPVDLDAVEHHLVRAAQSGRRGGPRRLGDGARAPRTAGPAAGSPVAAWCRRGSLRCDGRWPPTEGGGARPADRTGSPGVKGSWTWTTSKRPARMARTPRADGADRQGDRSHRSVGRQRHGAARWRTPRSPPDPARSPSTGANTVTAWPLAAERAGQAEDLALDASRTRQAVRADQGDPQRWRRRAGR